MSKTMLKAMATIASVLPAQRAPADLALVTPPESPAQAPSAAPPLSEPSMSPLARSKPDEPPLPLSERARKADAPERSWFARPPLSVAVGRGDRTWLATIYGFVEADVINDSTRSYTDSIG